MDICYNCELPTLYQIGEHIMNKAFPAALALILVIIVSACSVAPATPTNTLFFDDFSLTDSGWSQIQNDSGTAGYTRGQFHFSIVPKDTVLISNPGKSFPGDVSIDVDARKAGGPLVSYLGVLCHYQNANNYYMFLITTDGYAAIVMNKDGVLSIISPNLKFLKMDGIKTGTASNHIRATCIGEALTLFANGKQVSLAYDSSLTGGDVGLAVRSGRFQGGAEINFDNFLVTQP